MAETLDVTLRKTHGKREARRMRKQGHIPAILYGHGEANVNLTVPTVAFANAVRHGSRVVELKGAVSEKAFIRDLQWDVYGLDILHVDFARVSEHERIQLMVNVELRGEAPGVKEGGVIEHLVHEFEVECEALNIPDRIEVNVKDLQLNGSIHAHEVKLPSGVTLISDADAIVVHCVLPKEESEISPEAGGAEPEIIGRKAEDAEAEE